MRKVAALPTLLGPLDGRAPALRACGEDRASGSLRWLSVLTASLAVLLAAPALADIPQVSEYDARRVVRADFTVDGQPGHIYGCHRINKGWRCFAVEQNIGVVNMRSGAVRFSPDGTRERWTIWRVGRRACGETDVFEGRYCVILTHPKM